MALNDIGSITLFARNRRASTFIMREDEDTGKICWSFNRSPNRVAFILDKGVLPDGYLEADAPMYRQMSIYLDQDRKYRIMELSGNNASEWIRKAIDKAWNER